MPIDTFHRCTATVTRDDGETYVYSFIDEKPQGPSKATILAVHGFPDLAIAYGHQIRAWTQHGYRVLAPDCLGYGETDKPEDPKAYNPKEMAEDLKRSLDQVLGDDWKVIVVGHDWGSFLSQRFVGYHGREGRVLALILLSIPYMPPPPPPEDGEEPPVRDTLQLVVTPELRLPTGEVIKRPFRNFGYQLYFENPQSTIDIQENLDRFLHIIFQKLKMDNTSHRPKADNTRRTSITQATVDGQNVVSTGFGDAMTGKIPVDPNLPVVLTHEEYEHYRSKFEGKMTGPLNWYKTSTQRSIDDKTFPGLPPTLPVLLIYGKYDPTCLEYSLKLMRYLASVDVINARFEALDVGHWIMHERPDEVNKLSLNFLTEVVA